MGQQVCQKCIEDEALQRVVLAAADANECSFCGAKGKGIAAPVGVVVDHIQECLRDFYDDAINVLFYDSEDAWGYAGETWDTEDLLKDELELDLQNDRLREAVLEGVGRDIRWSVADPAVLEGHVELALDWREFCQRIKHAGRFFLLSDPQEGAVLKELGRLCTEFKLVRELPVGTKLVRARRQDGRRWTNAAELGPPPDDLATQSNRMSPPGISLFYAADDAATALDEMQTAGTYALAEFELMEPALVLDLTLVPPVPSFFDLDARPTRDGLIFLSRFSREVSQPIEHSKRINLDYIPTQVVTEYFRRIFKPELLGVRYASARRAGGICTALFAGATSVVDGVPGSQWQQEARWLRLSRRWQVRRRAR